MILQEFLDYRKTCPVCQNRLTTSFHSHRKQSSKTYDNRFMAIFNLTPLNKAGKDFKVGYGFGFTDLSFVVEFFTKAEELLYNKTDQFLIDRFKELHNNLRIYRFYRDCDSCRQYRYVSTEVKLDFKNSVYYNLDVGHEIMSFSQPINDGYRVYHLVDIINSDEGPNPSAVLFFCKSSFDRKSLQLDMPAEAIRLDLPFIPITSPEEMAKRFSNLMPFV